MGKDEHTKGQFKQFDCVKKNSKQWKKAGISLKSVLIEVFFQRSHRSHLAEVLLFSCPRDESTHTYAGLS